ncbi:DNA-3-methyladenine glycosylase I [Yaniella halotolerans]|uniref:DNA-3-methyladenine glycosylase I n=1 Tax=Yaniella halotolerans TaxID=225453 RepID=UPI0003B73C98|nr:DNA-3-methyladenine glycosylase I [Yaniella halotolerans]
MQQHGEVPGVVFDDRGVARPPWAMTHPLLRHYFDTEWGLPVRDEQGLFERLSLEGFQAGLSWLTILKKRPAFRDAFADFDPDVVASFSEDDVVSLMANTEIVRNRRKIQSVIGNAKATLMLRQQGGLAQLIWSYEPDSDPVLDSDGNPPSQSAESAALAKHLKKLGFGFVGPTIIFAMFEAIGVVNTFPYRELPNLSNTSTADYGGNTPNRKE